MISLDKFYIIYLFIIADLFETESYSVAQVGLERNYVAQASLELMEDPPASTSLVLGL